MAGILSILAGAIGATPPPAFGAGGGSALYAWGMNNRGQLGLGNTTYSFSSPQQNGVLTDWLSIACAQYSTIAIKTNGTLWAWGQNGNGQLGLGNITAYSSPKQIGALTNWKSISSAGYSVLAIKTDGTLWAWGDNSQGVLGLSNMTSYSSPKQVGALTNWSSISTNASVSAFGIKTDGTLWAWGNNQFGQLGLGNTTGYSSPKQVGALTTWSDAVASSQHLLAKKTDGTIWTCGRNHIGQLGLGNITAYSSPKQVGSLTTWSKIFTGTSDSYAIKTDGTLWSWGSNGNGQLGQGNTTNLSSPKQVGALTNWLNVAAAAYHTQAIKTDGTLWAWGWNNQGQLGLGNTTNYSSPKQVGSVTNWSSISAGYFHTIALTAPTKTVPDKPTNVAATAGDSSATVTFTAPSNGGSAITGYTVKAYTGGVYTGISQSGVSASITVTGLTNGTAYTFTVAATNAIGTGLPSDTSAAVTYYGISAFGTNSYGQLGLGDTTTRTTPTALNGSASWKSVTTTGYVTLGIRQDGTLWAWGGNSSGELGLGNMTNYSSPKQVGALTNWAKVANSPLGNQTCAIKTDGTMWTWGINNKGQLGLGNITNYSSPKQVGSSSNWSIISVGTAHMTAIKTDGTMWSWGDNNWAQLGLAAGDTTNRSSPTQVGSLTTWANVSSGNWHGIAIKTDGTMWSWGTSTNGELGQSVGAGTFQVGTDNTWKKVYCGYQTSFGIKTDGTLWSWGQNLYGQLGLGDSGTYAKKTSTTKVGLLTNWLDITCGYNSTLAVKTDGTLWGWGRNNSYQLGLGNTTNYSSPKQVGSLTTWSSATAGSASSCATFISGNNAVTPTPQTFVDDVFSTYLYTGNDSTQTITNGIDLAGKGGMVWRKARSSAESNLLTDTVNGGTKYLISNTTAAQGTSVNNITSFNSNGFSMGSVVNTNTTTYASWTFRKAAKFFDVVTWTGNGVAGRQIAHSLGTTVGMIIVKTLNTPDQWRCYHRALGATKQIFLNLTNAASNSGLNAWNNTEPTSTDFTVGTDCNSNGATYVAYLYAHDTSSTGIIQCGSFTTDGSGNATVNFGWEPQYVMVKSSSADGAWVLEDIMRGGFDMSVASGGTGTSVLLANSSGAEGTDGSTYNYPTSTGFQVNFNYASRTFIYMAIRRPNKPPTTGTQVYNTAPRLQGTTSTPTYTSGFVTDMGFYKNRTTGAEWKLGSRLQGAGLLIPNLTDAEVSVPSEATWAFMNGWYTDSDNTNVQSWMFKRAPGFFDVVCYTGNGVARTVAHNLGVEPELIIVKDRTSAFGWPVYAAPLGNAKGLQLEQTAAAFSTSWWNSTSPSSSVFNVSSNPGLNLASDNYVAYLFATLAGISKVGSYTGNGGTQAIPCGFTSGSRFVMIKRTNAAGDWLIVDSARGINANQDPLLKLNSTAAEVTTDDWIDADTSGFVVNQTSAANANVSGATYIFLAIS